MTTWESRREFYTAAHAHRSSDDQGCVARDVVVSPCMGVLRSDEHVLYINRFEMKTKGE